MHVTLEVPDPLPADDVVRKAAANGLAVQGLAHFAADARLGRTGIVVGYGTPPPHLFTTALARLLTVLSSA